MGLFSLGNQECVKFVQQNYPHIHQPNKHSYFRFTHQKPLFPCGPPVFHQKNRDGSIWTAAILCSDLKNFKLSMKHKIW